MARKLTAVSLFSGCGGFDWGASQVGVDIIWANDIDASAATAYRSLFPDATFTQGDIRDIATFPEADILIGCYPCTGFSVAARRRWRGRNERDLIKDDTNHLYKEFLRALKQIKPKYLFVENVNGMRTAAGGWFWNEQLQGFRDAGYVVPEPKLLDASHYGVAQTRKRLFIAGIRNDVELEYSYPEPTHGPDRPDIYSTMKDKIAGMPEWPDGEYIDRDFHGHYLTRNRKRKWSDRSYTIVAHAHHVPLHPMGDPMIYVSKDMWALQGDKNRRLSWRECARIQDLPNHIDFKDTSLMNKYRVVGNAVPSALGRVLLKPIAEFESAR